MSETREIRAVETVSSVWPASGLSTFDNGDIDNNFTESSQSPGAIPWVSSNNYPTDGYTFNNEYWTANNVYLNPPNGPDTEKFTLVLNPDSLLKANTTLNIPATRCSVSYNLYGQSSTLTGLGGTGQNESELTLTWAYSGAKQGQPDKTTDNPMTATADADISAFVEINQQTAPTFYEIGSDASYYGTSGTDNWPMTLTLQGEKISGGGDVDFQHFRISVRGEVRRWWEGNHIRIDGIDGDTLPTFTTTSTITADGFVDKKGSAQLDTNFSIAEDSFAKVSADSAIDSTSTFSITPSFIIDPTTTVSGICSLQTTTANFVFADSSVSSNSNISVVPTFKLGSDSAISANNTASFIGNLIYDIGGEYSWDNISQTSDYQWDDRDSWTDWTDNTWGEELLTWDDWYLNTWDRPFSVFNTFTTEETPTFKPGGIFANTASFDISENVAFKEPAEFSTTANFGTSFTARGIIDQGSSIQANFSTDYLANIIYDGIANFDGVLTAEIIANTIFELISTPPAQFSTTIVPTKKLIGDTNMAVAFEILEKLGNIIYDAQSEMDAFNAQIVAGSLFTQTDPYNIAKVLEETRQFLINIETRQHLINGENRLNTIKAESRNILVPEETRKYKLKVAPMTNRFSTPKVRSKQ